MKLLIYKMLSFVLGLVAVELLLTFAGFSYNLLQRTQNPQSIDKPKETKLILCLGESTTAWGLSDSYPAQLQKILNENFGPGKYLVINEGESATDTGIILSKLNEKIARYRPDIIITMMGINDYWRLAHNKMWYSNFKLYQLFQLIKINYPQLFQKKIVDKKILSPAETTPPADEPLIFENKNLGADFLEAESLYHQKNFALAYEKLSVLHEKKFNSSQLSLYLAVASLELGHKEQGLKFFKEFTQLHNSAAAYSFVGEYYYNKFGVFDSNNQQHARYFFKKALEINPKNFSALKHLGCSYVNNLHKEPGLRQDALKHLSLAASISLNDADALACLADLSILENNLPEAVSILTKGLHLREGSAFFIRTRLVETYLKLRDYENAEQVLHLTKEQFEFNPRLDFLEREIQSQRAGGSNPIAKITAHNFYEHSETQKNYKSIARIIAEKKIVHIVLQYPLRPVMPLKKTLNDFPEIIFIENIDNFKAALSTKTYNEIFIDNFAEDFGHFSAYGSKIISENIFNTLKANKIFTAH